MACLGTNRAVSQNRVIFKFTMRKVLFLFARVAIVLVLLIGALFVYFIYSPNPQVPPLSGRLVNGTIQADGLTRSYLTYVPQGLRKGVPLLLVMHGSGEHGSQMRRATGYGFERLADERKFVVVYPDGYEGYWNTCNVVGDYSANKLNVNDVGFLTSLVDKLVLEIGVDPRLVFATGISRGGHMAFRLALEAPAHFRAVAAVAANVPVPENFKCKPTGHGTSSILIMNGTKDPINPFDGGDVTFFGLLERGRVLSSRDSGQYFANLNDISDQPETKASQLTDTVQVRQILWRKDLKPEVELISVIGGGHVMPQPYWRAPRLLGPTPKEPNGPAVIWEFFERQAPR